MVSTWYVGISSMWNDQSDEMDEIMSVDRNVSSSESEFKLRLRYFDLRVGVGGISECVDANERTVGHV